MKIHKKSFPIGPGIFHLDLPAGAQILSFEKQRKSVACWFAFDPAAIGTGMHTIQLVETGNPFDPVGGYRGTLLFEDDNYVLHVWHRTPEAQ